MGRRARALLMLMLLTSAAVRRPPAARAASAFAGALEPTQMANFVQLVEHTIHFIQMVQRMKQQVQYWQQTLKGFDGANFALAASMVQGVGALVMDLRGITFAAKASIETYKKDHPGHAAPKDDDYQKAYRDLDKQTMQSVERALKTMNTTMMDEKGGLKAQHEVVQQIAKQIDSADGQVKAAQITNRLLEQLIYLAEKQLVVMTAHAQQMGMAIANETQRRAYKETAQEKLLKYKAPTARPVDWSKQGLRGI